MKIQTFITLISFPIIFLLGVIAYYSKLFIEEVAYSFGYVLQIDISWGLGIMLMAILALIITITAVKITGS